MSEEKVQALIRRSVATPTTPVDVELLWDRARRRSRRRHAVTGAVLASVVIVLAAASTAALNRGSDEELRTGAAQLDGAGEPNTNEDGEGFERGSPEHLLALADCVRARGFDPIVDLEDGRIEVHVPPEQDPVPVCEEELAAAGVVASPRAGMADPGARDAMAADQAAEAARRQAEAEHRRATEGISAPSSNDARAGGDDRAVTAPAADGTLRGTLQLVGGRAGADPMPVPGTVEVRRLDSSTAFTVETTSDGRFEIELEPGEYLLEGRSPQYSAEGQPCHAGDAVEVRAGEATEVTVDCDMR